MRQLDIAVIGSGIGGALIASLHKDKNLILFEKDHNLGGCASTFSRYGDNYNAGATTFVGYETGHVIKKMFDKIGFKPDLKQSYTAISTIQNNQVLDRIEDFETFLQALDTIYPHPNNRIFWSAIKKMDERFWKLKKLYFNRFSLQAWLKTFAFGVEALCTFGMQIFQSAKGFIHKTLPNISKEYLAFIDAQLLITLQSKHDGIPLLAMALGLAYPFHKVYYPNGGMGSLITALLEGVDVHNKEAITRIQLADGGYILHSTKSVYFAKKVVLNTNIYDSSKLFEDGAIKRYYDKFSFSDQSAFVVYAKVKSDQDLLHHYQIILDKQILNCISNSFFISISDTHDTKMSQDGYSVTISTHTKAFFWQTLSKEEYKKQKNATEAFILSKLQKHLPHIKVMRAFSATSKTFDRYIARLNCGGRALSFANILQMPPCNTPFRGLYNIGDTVFAGQGWPGVALGVSVLDQELTCNKS
ncbi:MAG: FAD-dependent oxidoreductase [Sulfurospirillum sp.]|nr:FAD-dependent oxidoreductase [Sulfurospirillum sp.]